VPHYIGLTRITASPALSPCCSHFPKRKTGWVGAVPRALGVSWTIRLLGADLD
jgi:hypothetical protein